MASFDYLLCSILRNPGAPARRRPPRLVTPRAPGRGAGGLFVRRFARTAALVSVAAALIATSGTPPVEAPVRLAALSADAQVTITGHGYGHGRGMGQYGSYGYATRHGWSHQQILAHYYGNTVLSQVGNPLMTVRLTGSDGRAMSVFSDRGFYAGGTWIAPGDAVTMVAKPSGGATVTATAGCGGRTYWVRDTAGTRADPPVEGLNRPTAENLRLCSTGTRYRGSLVAVNDGGVQRTVSSLSTEDYLRGVVPSESPASWADSGGAAALRAQAVAARSYSLSESRYRYAKTCDSQSCQVYTGSGAEDRRSDAAILATAGVVLTRGGAAVRAEFSSSTGGHTAGGLFPAVPDAGDAVSPYATWTTTVTAGSIARAYGIGELVSMDVSARNGLGLDGGRATQVRIVGTQGTVTRTGDQVRITLGLRSDWFRIAVAGTVPGAVPGAVPGTTPAGFSVGGAIGERYQALGGARSILGAATTNELGTADGVARYNHFQGGSIYWSPATGAREVYGSIGERWAGLRREAGPLGLPITGELGTPNGRGRYNHFQSGSLYWSPATGAQEVYGAVRDVWAAQRWEAGVLGFPTTGETATSKGTGRYNHFEGGSVYWSPATGAHEVHGAIRQAWAAGGWETGSLGFPTSHEHDVPGGRASRFQGGTLTYSWATGQVVRS
ncbi:SpoIID/LytB domain-containing protein [Rhodococcus sp. X156]|uniref:SpoIID/LytB domain-containing protein n=1 Tax=Rhodococcus sp. X156 TaxID=2499145 RepID=UPI000FDA4C03|nr:SpoIID/LytB domain-containing protein [Rhodococcus sp. X156]